MEFDIWIPKYKLCFEFQDSYHYISTWYYHKSKEFVHKKDEMKRNEANQQGMSLVTVPCWWNGDKEQLVSTICFQRPDLQSLIHSSVTPINLNPPKGFFSASIVPGVGELMLASISQQILSSLPRDSWWLGEKYDGLRFTWNPYTRHGNVINLLSGYYNFLPSFFLDGEIWFGRGQFSLTNELIQTDDCNWSQLRCISFDVPSVDWQRTPYEERYTYLLQNITFDHPFNIITARKLTKSNGHAQTMLQQVIEGGGEGIILQKKASLYEQGRSLSLLKMKVAHTEQEGIVAGIGSKNSVSLRLPSGARVTVPTYNVHIPTPSVGDIVTFSFEGNDPSPKIIRVRTDVNWNNVVHNFYRDEQFYHKISRMRGMREHGYWSPSNTRSYLEKFVKSRKMDPNHPKTWYAAYKLLMNSKTGRTILAKIKRNYFQIIEKLFPKVKFDSNAVIQFHHWNKIENRRKFFEDYAKENEFDPLLPQNWYAQPCSKITAVKGAKRLIYYHGYSVAQALVDLFPNIGLERSKLFSQQKAFNTVVRRRNFFEFYAVEKGFDPLVAENWYMQPIPDIMAAKGIHMVLFYHSASLSKALADLFPNIGIDRAKFSSKVSAEIGEKHKLFFLKYAKKSGFDPQVAENWYIQIKDTILSTPGAHKVLGNYGYSVPRALVQLFPDIGLDKSKFPRQGTWDKFENRRKFFEDIAKSLDFDPLVPDHWYLQSKDKIRSFKGVDKVLFYHYNSVSNALLDLFPNIGLDRSKFLHQNVLSNVETRKKVFEDYAHSKGFDPLLPENWSPHYENLMKMKNVRKMIHYHGNSLQQALSDLFYKRS